ncbi:Bax inhibitor-1 family protein [Rahnella rivi]|uniref:Bax inhibitor-1/YccA family protein n=1 Tax=Rahnella rivi TaxID=2816249 RepID=UPI00161A6E0B|nr:hypothetical protein [Rahnella inusitata]
MDRYPRSNGSIVERANTGIQAYMAQVYGWMFCGLLLTGAVAWYAAQTRIPYILATNSIALIGLIVAQFALVFVISGMVNRLSGAVATGLFMLYSVLTGITFSSIFLIYTGESIFGTFIVAAGMFGAMSAYGYVTKRDLTGIGSMLFMALIGLVLASLVNMWLKSSGLANIISYAGVLIFVGLTAYDTQKLKNMGAQLSADDRDNFRKYSIVGALTLYLDFINLFLMLLRIFGNRR